ncbi:hypothetical protein CDAR_181211 [Caerostris darwini]|uniref:C2H2-type domain-containing protein n=1 Tax=Caerostris darwini TaxID=1538125 RepID=A0AAV4U3X1_9ARAC|nr:hypothetical protein CDAR_181211 [Caerostris darwini]
MDRTCSLSHCYTSVRGVREVLPHFSELHCRRYGCEVCRKEETIMTGERHNRNPHPDRPTRAAIPNLIEQCSESNKTAAFHAASVLFRNPSIIAAGVQISRMDLSDVHISADILANACYYLPLT